MSLNQDQKPEQKAYQPVFFVGLICQNKLCPRPTNQPQPIMFVDIETFDKEKDKKSSFTCPFCRQKMKLIVKEAVKDDPENQN